MLFVKKYFLLASVIFLGFFVMSGLFLLKLPFRPSKIPSITHALPTTSEKSVHPDTNPAAISPTSSKRIALTFDDGPYGTSTAAILDILRDEHVPATFFVLGNNVLKFPEEARQEALDGHVIGNHSLDHAKTLPTMPTSTFEANIAQAQAIIASTTNIYPTLFRPPYGNLSSMMRQTLKKDGYRTVLWNVDPNDWDISVTSDQIIERVLAQTKPGSIILLHDGRDTEVNYPRTNTVEALPRLIKALRSRGYTFVRIDELSS